MHYFYTFVKGKVADITACNSLGHNSISLLTKSVLYLDAVALTSFLGERDRKTKF